MATVSALDIENLEIIRNGVDQFISACAKRLAMRDGVILDIAPQTYKGAKGHFPATVKIETLDIDPKTTPTYVADICQTNAAISTDRFDVIVCTEVLEHVVQPFLAVEEIRRMLKPGGCLIGTTPFNFRIHGPLPDCWRFTEHGLRAFNTNSSPGKPNALEPRFAEN